MPSWWRQYWHDSPGDGQEYPWAVPVPDSEFTRPLHRVKTGWSASGCPFQLCHGGRSDGSIQYVGWQPGHSPGPSRLPSWYNMGRWHLCLHQWGPQHPRTQNRCSLQHCARGDDKARPDTLSGPTRQQWSWLLEDQMARGCIATFSRGNIPRWSVALSMVRQLHWRFNLCTSTSGALSMWQGLCSQKDAFEWLRQVAGSTDVIKDLEELTEPPHIFQMPTTFASDLHRALKVARRTNKHFLQQLADLKWADDTQRLILKDGGWHIPTPNDATMDSPPTRVACPESSKYFRDAASLATHRFKAHNVKVAARRFSPTTTCIACGKGFSTRPRLIVHLQYSSRRCLPWLLMHSAAIDEETANSLDEEAAVDALQERRSGVRSNLSRLPVNYDGSNAVPAVHIDPIAPQERPVMEGIAPIQEAQLTFIAKWKDVEGVWPLCEHTWWLFTDDLIKAMDQCPYECHQSFAGRLTDMVDEVCWRQDDFELVLEAQERLAAVLHSYAPSRRLVRQPLKSKEEVFKGWEEEYGSLPVWMGLRTRSTRPRCGDDSHVLFPSRLAAIERSWQQEVLAWRPGEQVARQSSPRRSSIWSSSQVTAELTTLGRRYGAWTFKAVWYGLSVWTCASTKRKATYWMHGSKTYGKGRSWMGWWLACMPHHHVRPTRRRGICPLRQGARSRDRWGLGAFLGVFWVGQ